MKKFMLLLITSLLTLSFAACTPSVEESAIPSISPSTEPTPSESTVEPTPTPTPVSKDICALGEYIIVYPEKYENPRQMVEVELLAQVIETLSGNKPQTVSDSEVTLTGKNYIIFASSNIKTEFDDKIKTLADEMDYVICVDKDKNIILGGKTYYSDMRAAYDFINNYLGYDDVEDVYEVPKKEITGEFTYLYQKPAFIIAAHNAFNNLFTLKAVRDAKNAHFNLITLYNLYGAAQFFTEENCKDVATWCVRYEMYFMTSSPADFSTNEVSVPCEDFLADNPMVYGIYLYDEPGKDLIPKMHILADNFKEKYAEYGWKCYVNHFPFQDVWDLLKDSEYLSNTEITGFDKYLMNYKLTDNEWEDYITMLETARFASRKNGQELWLYLESRDKKEKDKTKQYTGKSFRMASYIAMSFGASGINYFCYADPSNVIDIVPDETWCYDECLVDKDFNLKDNWYDAQISNSEIEKMSKLYSAYENTGAYLVGGSFEKNYYDFDNVLEQILDKNGNIPSDQKYLVGCFDQKDGNGSAFTLINIESLNAQKFDSARGKKVKLKINGENVTFYLEGEKIDVDKDENGYYELRLGNGGCLFVTVD